MLASPSDSNKPLYEDKLIMIHKGKNHTTYCDGIQHWVKTNHRKWYKAELHRIVRTHLKGWQYD